MPQIVTDEYTGVSAAGKIASEFQNVVGLLDGDVVRRFVEDHDFRLELQGAGNGYALSLTAGEPSDFGVRRAQVESDVAERVFSQPPHFGFPQKSEIAETPP